jgi:hypothetical protein
MEFMVDGTKYEVKVGVGTVFTIIPDATGGKPAVVPDEQWVKLVAVGLFLETGITDDNDRTIAEATDTIRLNVQRIQYKQEIAGDILKGVEAGTFQSSSTKLGVGSYTPRGTGMGPIVLGFVDRNGKDYPLNIERFSNAECINMAALNDLSFVWMQGGPRYGSTLVLDLEKYSRNVPLLRLAFRVDGADYEVDVGVGTVFTIIPDDSGGSPTVVLDKQWVKKE